LNLVRASCDSSVKLSVSRAEEELAQKSMEGSTVMMRGFAPQLIVCLQSLNRELLYITPSGTEFTLALVLHSLL